MTALVDLITPAPVVRAGNAKLPILSMTMHGGLVDQSQKFKKRVASNDLSEYKVVSRGQLVVGFPIDEGVLDFQALYENGIVSPAYGVWDLIADETIDRNYFKLFLRSPRAMAYYKARLRGSTARRRSLPSDVFLALEVPVPPIGEQRRIAAILGHADVLRTRRRKVVAELNNLARAVFEDAFSNGVHDSTATLDDLATTSSGMTKGRRTSDPTRPVPYLAVANVQAGYLDLGQVKSIDATEKEIERYALVDGDLVLTEGGDPDKLGRGTVWRGELPLCLHQNHIFRVRVTSNEIHPDYLSAYLGSRPAKDYFLRAAKQTTGIASINMTQLRRTPVSVPPMVDQESYLQRVHDVTELVRGAEAQAAELDTLFASLQSRAFSGRL